MIRLVALAGAIVLLVGCGFGREATPQPTYAPVPPEMVPTFPTGSRTVVVEFVLAQGYAIGWIDSEYRTKSGDTYTVYSDGTVDYRPRDLDYTGGSGDLRRKSVKLRPSAAMDLQQVLADPQWDQLLHYDYYHTDPKCERSDGQPIPDCGYQRFYLINGGGRRVQTDGTGPPVVRERFRRLEAIQSQFWETHRKSQGTPQP